MGTRVCQLPGPHPLSAFIPAPVMLQLPGPHRLSAFIPAPVMLQHANLSMQSLSWLFSGPRP